MENVKEIGIKAYIPPIKQRDEKIEKLNKHLEKLEKEIPVLRKEGHKKDYKIKKSREATIKEVKMAVIEGEVSEANMDFIADIFFNTLKEEEISKDPKGLSSIPDNTMSKLFTNDLNLV